MFVDTNVFMYAVGREHPLRDDAQRFFVDAVERGTRLCTSAEVLQELLHAYVPVRRMDALDNALRLAGGAMADIWPVESEDVRLARALAEKRPALRARDLLHLACCERRDVTAVKTFDRALASAFVRR